MQFVLLTTLLIGSLATAVAEVVGYNASLPQCRAAMDGKLPSYLPSSFKFSGNVRRYYITSEIEEWDYIPSGWDNWLGVPANDSFRVQNAGYLKTNDTMGTKYDKAVYRGYTDQTFTKKSEQPSWLGLQGPIIRAEIGDMVEILFVNNVPNYTTSMHSMGLFYSKENEGSVYYNMSKGPGPGDSVEYQSCFVYKWLVTDELAPVDGDSRLLGYHGFVSMPQDTNTGLYGPNIIYNRGTMNKTMRENREFVMSFSEQDETNSFLTAHNVKKQLPEYYKETVSAANDPPAYPGMNFSFWNPQQLNSPNVQGLSDACGTYFVVNGYAFSNNPSFESCVDDPVIWYIYNLGDAAHAVHWHGNNVAIGSGGNGMRVPTVGVHPGELLTFQMNVANPGIWEVLCHYSAHKLDGMDALYTVHPRDKCPIKPLTNEKKRQRS